MNLNPKVALPFLLLSSLGAAAQAPNGWHLQDKAKDGYYGISIPQAYDFVKGKKSTTVVVAVIDSGIDTTHEDLRSKLWINAKEVPGNGIDDDRNGYVDDVHGWNFLGNKDGRNVGVDSYEAARVYHAGKARFEGVKDASSLSPADQTLYRTWLRAKAATTGGQTADPVFFAQIKNNVEAADSSLKAELKKESYTFADINAADITSPGGRRAKAFLKQLLQMTGQKEEGSASDLIKQVRDEIDGELRKAEAATKAPPAYRGDIVGDNEADINDRGYGNNDLMANTPMHGTHVSGIIAAARGNGKGSDGVAENVRIMTLRAVPDGDEHDKDVALAIRYAVDNGAKVINMSFGKSFSPQKEWVDDAVRYAESKGVLLVHAAGNSAENIDTTFNYPETYFGNDRKARASNWIEVGASGDPKNGSLVASFSNWGRDEVDVFAPGHQIYAPVPGGNTYANLSGTSMASPVTAGVAAFILSYYPTLTPQQVKLAIESSATPVKMDVVKPGGGKKVPFSTLSRTGGLINAHAAIQAADRIVTGKSAVANTTTKTATPAKKGKVVPKTATKPAPKATPKPAPKPVKTF